jgi:hypothetical protein
MGRRQSWYIAGGWAVIRLWLLLTTLGVLPDPESGATVDVDQIYRPWAEILGSGTFPLDDDMWQYPPGAAGILLGPDLFPWWTYRHAFIALMLIFDAVVLLCLLRSGRNAPDGKGSPLGGWLWVVAPPILGPIVLSRYDLAVTGLAVLALTLIGRTRLHHLGGFIAGVAASVKVWPVLLVLGVGGWRKLSTTALWTVAGAAAVCLGFAAAMPGAFSFLQFQGERGVEVESIFATPFLIARHFGWSGNIQFTYGCLEFHGPWVALFSKLAMASSVLGFGWLVLWRVKARVWNDSTAFDTALTAMLIFVVTSRVLSPQYMIWLVGLAALCLTRASTTQRPAALLILAATPLTYLEFPFWFSEVLSGDVLATTVLIIRNLLLVVATCWSATALWYSTKASGLQVPQRDSATQKETVTAA